MTSLAHLHRPVAGALLALLAGVSASGAASATTFATIHAFHGADGIGDFSGLTPDGSGGYFGGSLAGGAHGKGDIFHLLPPAAGQSAWSLKVIYNFTGGSDGAGESVALARDGSGNLYGMAAGGANGYGTVFRLSPPGPATIAWSFETLHAFAAVSTDGCYAPFGALQIDGSGALYGTTQECGLFGEGTAFRLAPPAPGSAVWKETILHNFTGGNDGTFPLGGVTLAPNGRLYGTAYQGGQDKQGTIFQIAQGAQGWGLSVLHAFNGTDGGSPMAAPVLGNLSATLYGTSYSGGSIGYGTIYSIAPPPSGQGAWQYRILHSIAADEGQEMYCGVAMAANGTLYGSILYGGANVAGSVYALTPHGAGWSFATLHSFAKTGSGGHTAGCVTLDGATVLGGTETGGTLGDGTLFAVTP